MSGMGLYDHDGDRWRWAEKCTGPGSRQNGGPIIQGGESGERKWRMYLPLYNGLESLDIGVPEGDLRSGDASRDEAGGVLHFDSARGVCASRPGVAWPSIVGRRLDRPTINLGFSGNGRMEIEVARLLAQFDAAAYVIDCTAT